LGTDKFITFSVDSCEDIQVETQDKNFSTAYKVTGSPASTNIQMLRKSLINIQLQIDKLGSLSGAAHAAKLNEITAAIEKHKQMAKGFIMANPGSTVAYFAIYQQINGTLLFSPYAKEDAPYYKAVATSYNTYMPEYVRTKNLYSLVMDAIKTERSNNARREWKEIVDKAGKGYIDIALKDKKDVEHKLSDLDGKVVLLDFTSYQAEGAVDYVFALRELYNKYHSRGFEIYQVSVDQNKVLWQQSVENIPWVCVRDDNGPNAVCLSTYNVTSIPTTFLLTRSGNIIKRSPGFDELNKLIEANL
jgi:peroxiredoxin